MRVLLRHGGSACVVLCPGRDGDGGGATGLQVKQLVAAGSGVGVECMRLVCGANEVHDEALVPAPSEGTRPCEVQCVLRLSGGKGGFGAMLRSARGGLDAKKTTNFDAMRDLSGRRSAMPSCLAQPHLTNLPTNLGDVIWMSARAGCRIRHVNNEKKLREWIEAAPERDAAAKRCACSCCRSVWNATNYVVLTRVACRTGRVQRKGVCPARPLDLQPPRV